MADVFLSYAKADRPLAERTVAALQAAGRSVWWDDEITPHGSWDATIERELNAARAVLVLWTPRSVASDFVRAEAQWAKGQGKLVPARLEPCTLPIAFSMVQTAQLEEWAGEADHPGWQRVLRWLDGAGPTKPVPDAASPRPAAPAAATSAATRRQRWLAPAALVAALAVGAIGLWQAGAVGGAPAPVFVDAVDTGPARCSGADAFADHAVPDTCLRCPSGMKRTAAPVSSPAACSKPGGNGSFPAVRIGDDARGIGDCPGGFRDATIPGCWSCRGGSRKVLPNFPKVTDPDACEGERPPVTAPVQSLGPPACTAGAFRLPGQANCLACPPGSSKTDDGRCQVASGRST